MRERVREVGVTAIGGRSSSHGRRFGVSPAGRWLVCAAVAAALMSPTIRVANASSSYDSPCGKAGRMGPASGSTERRSLSDFEGAIDVELFFRELVDERPRTLEEWADLIRTIHWLGGWNIRLQGLEDYRSWREWEPAQAVPTQDDLGLEQRAWLDRWRAAALADPAMGRLRRGTDYHLDPSDQIDLIFADLARGFRDGETVFRLAGILLGDDRYGEAIDLANRYVLDHPGDPWARQELADLLGHAGQLADPPEVDAQPEELLAWADQHRLSAPESVRLEVAGRLMEALPGRSGPRWIERVCRRIDDLSRGGRPDRGGWVQGCVSRQLGSTEALLSRSVDGWREGDFETVYDVLRDRVIEAVAGGDLAAARTILSGSPDFRRMQLWEVYVDEDVGTCGDLSVAYRNGDFDDWVFTESEVLECPKKVLLLDRMLRHDCEDTEAHEDLRRRLPSHLVGARWATLAYIYGRKVPGLAEDEIFRRLDQLEAIPYRRVHQWVRTQASAELRLAFYERWQADDPEATTPIYGRLRELEADGSPVELAIGLRAAVGRRPEDLDLRLWNASVALEEGRRELAKRAARSVLASAAATERQRGDARLILGRAARSEGRLEEASAYLESFFSERLRFNGCHREAATEPCDLGFVLHLIEAGDLERLDSYAKHRQRASAEYYAAAADKFEDEYWTDIVRIGDFESVREYGAWRAGPKWRSEIDIPELLNRRFRSAVAEYRDRPRERWPLSADTLLANPELMPHVRREPAPSR